MSAAPRTGATATSPSVPKSTGPQWMTTAEAAAMLGVTIRTLYRLIDEGALPAYQLGRVIRLRTAEVEAYRDADGGGQPA